MFETDSINNQTAELQKKSTNTHDQS